MVDGAGIAVLLTLFVAMVLVLAAATAVVLGIRRTRRSRPARSEPVEHPAGRNPGHRPDGGSPRR